MTGAGGAIIIELSTYSQIMSIFTIYNSALGEKKRMKYCKKCGKEMDNYMKFCPRCGTECSGGGAGMERGRIKIRFTDRPENNDGRRTETAMGPGSGEYREKSGKKIREKVSAVPKKKIILFSVLALSLVVLITAGVLVLGWYTSAGQQVLRALDAGDYSAALAAVERADDPKSIAKMTENLRKRIGEIKSDFSQGAIPYETARMELTTIKNMGIKSISTEITEIQIFVEKLNESRTNFATAESFFSTGDYKEAISHYRQVIEDDENYDAAAARLADSLERYREQSLNKAKEYADAELYANAINTLDEALTVIPNDAKLTEQKRLYEKSDVEKQKADALSEAAALARNGDYLGAVKALNSVMNTQSSDAELISAYNGYCDKYAAKVITTAEEKVKVKDFEGAISALNAALKEVPGNKKLAEKLEEVKSRQPVPITNLTAINSSRWGKWNSGSPKDPFGNDYSSACNYVIVTEYYWYEEGYVEYRLYGNYTTLTGMIAPYTEMQETSKGFLQVYVDDVLVYTSKDVERKTDAFSFEVNVSGAEYIKLVYTLNDKGYSILSDVQLWP